MKNIHILPTEKPSSLYYKDDNYKLANSTIAIDWYISSAGYKPTNIYITNDENIKEGDWYLYCNLINKRIRKNPKAEYPYPNYQKIILTTDPDLINDGVQKIDDEFLEWFVKNPCEWVHLGFTSNITSNGRVRQYKLIIPHDVQPKDVVLGHKTSLDAKMLDEVYKDANKDSNEDNFFEELKQYFEETPREKVCNCGLKESEHNVRHPFIPREQTLEEAAEDWVFGTNGHKWSNNDDTAGDNYSSFISGAKWQAEQLFKDDVIQTLEKCIAFLLKKQEKSYTEEEFLQFSEWISSEDWVYLQKCYWVNEEQEELEQKLTTEELFEIFKNRKK
jgi:hypothetical protein